MKSHLFTFLLHLLNQIKKIDKKCPHRRFIPLFWTGICDFYKFRFTFMTIIGKLTGKSIKIAKEKTVLDRYGRTINTLRVSVTDKCNLNCVYCKPSGIMVRKKTPHILSLEQTVSIVKEAVGLGLVRIKLTGGEPLLRKNIIYLVEKLTHIPGISDLSMTTNGTLLPLYANDLKKAGLQRVNISLDSVNPDNFTKITGGTLDDVFKGIEAARQAGLSPIKINTVYLPNYNRDEIDRIRSFCRKEGLKHQLINQMNINKEKKLYEDFCTTDKPPRCSSCSRMRLSVNGTLLPCLFDSTEIAIADFPSIKEALTYAVDQKPAEGRHNAGGAMYRIGG